VIASSESEGEDDPKEEPTGRDDKHEESSDSDAPAPPAKTGNGKRWVVSSDKPAHAGVYEMTYQANYLDTKQDSIKV